MENGEAPGLDMLHPGSEGQGWPNVGSQILAGAPARSGGLRYAY